MSTDPTNVDNPIDDVEITLELLRPRMRKARISHMRRVAAGLALVPLVGFGAAAMASEGGGVVLDTASPALSRPTTTLAEPAAVALAEEADPPTTTSEPADKQVGVDKPRTVSLGDFGVATVNERDGSFTLSSIEPKAGWELLSDEIVDGVLVVVIADGEIIKAIRITPGVRDRIDVRVTDVVIPPPTTEPPPVTEPPATTAAVNRWVIPVEGKGSFVVERDGDVLFLGNVTDADGYTHDVAKAEGWKVHVVFTDGVWLWHAKAYIDDNGDVQQAFWDEAKPPAPVYQWVEIPGVGAAKFQLLDGQVHVIRTEAAVGYSSYVYNEVGVTVKVDFEGEGRLWLINAGILDGHLTWEIVDATPTPSTTTVPAVSTTTAATTTTAPPAAP